MSQTDNEKEGETRGSALRIFHFFAYVPPLPLLRFVGEVDTHNVPQTKRAEKVVATALELGKGEKEVFFI